MVAVAILLKPYIAHLVKIIFITKAFHMRTTSELGYSSQEFSCTCKEHQLVEVILFALVLQPACHSLSPKLGLANDLVELVPLRLSPLLAKWQSWLFANQ